MRDERNGFYQLASQETVHRSTEVWQRNTQIGVSKSDVLVIGRGPGDRDISSEYLNLERQLPQDLQTNYRRRNLQIMPAHDETDKELKELFREFSPASVVLHLQRDDSLPLVYNISQVTEGIRNKNKATWTADPENRQVSVMYHLKVGRNLASESEYRDKDLWNAAIQSGQQLMTDGIPPNIYMEVPAEQVRAEERFNTLRTHGNLRDIVMFVSETRENEIVRYEYKLEFDRPNTASAHQPTLVDKPPVIAEVSYSSTIRREPSPFKS